jgi:4-amino-4-deoxy-L-arabinose transferase-like glycosyltransferase
MVAVAATLTAFSGRYGFHRDELYFLMLEPTWGYVDQPPLAPLLARMFSQVLGAEPWAIRIPATLAVTTTVLVLALVTRELGGGRSAQALCAWGFAFAAVPMIMGHALLTSSLDLPVWPAIVLFVMRALLRNQGWWWLAAGLVAGLSTYNKLLVAVLLVALAAGLALAGPRRKLWSPWTLGGVALALAVAAPNLVYQAVHDWPQLAMGDALSENNGTETRALMWPFLLLMLGPPLVPVWVAGWVGLVRRPQWRPVRSLAVAFPVLLALVFAMGAQLYYPFGLLSVLFAAGCVPAAAWAARSPVRRWVLAGGLALNGVVSVVLGLPVVPVSELGATPVPAINQVARDSVGWPTYVEEIAAAARTVPPALRSKTVVVTSNYGEAGAVARYGGPLGLPRAYSGHNQLYYEGRPPDEATVAVMVGGQLPAARPLFHRCDTVGRLDNRVGVGNEEQGQPVAICRGPIGGWAAVWPALQHLD